MIKLTTNLGVITLQLDAEKAPKTVANFEQYVREGHYDGTIFHRIIKGFMIQGGGFAPGMLQKPTHDAIQNEANNGLKNKAYAVALARTSARHSASAQFFINVVDNGFLDFTAENSNGWGYCVFGEVVEGREVIDQMKTVKTGRRDGHQDVPLDDVVVEKAEIIEG